MGLAGNDRVLYASAGFQLRFSGARLGLGKSISRLVFVNVLGPERATKVTCNRHSLAHFTFAFVTLIPSGHESKTKVAYVIRSKTSHTECASLQSMTTTATCFSLANHHWRQKANPTAPISSTYDTALFHRNGSRKTRNANTVNTIRVIHSCMILSWVRVK